MNAAFLSFERFKVYIQECQQQLRTMGYNSRDIAHFQIWADIFLYSYEMDNTVIPKGKRKGICNCR
jgi:hypothetical protein